MQPKSTIQPLHKCRRDLPNPALAALHFDIESPLAPNGGD